jgi:hypothetical protein
MKTNKYIKILLDNGLNVKTISRLNESQIKVLADKFNKLEIKEATKQVVTNMVFDPNNATDQKDLASKGIHIDPGTKKISMTLGPTGEMKEDETLDIVNDPAATADGMPTTEGEMNERFKSSAQQKFFWNKCTKSNDKKSKWCKWADEFQQDTKDKRLPKKLHPEKTVNVKTEGYEKFLEDSIVEMVDRYINPAMTKSQLVKRINEKVDKSESFMLRNPKKNSMFSQDEGKEMKTMKRPIGKMYSMEMFEDTKEKERTKEKDTDTKEKDKGKDRKNPFAPKYDPAPKAGDTKEKERTKEKDTDTKEKDKDRDKGRKEPWRPKHNPAPKASDTKEKERTKERDTDTKEKDKDRDKGRKDPWRPKYDPAPKAKKEFKENTLRTQRTTKGPLPNFLKWNKLGVNLK